MVASTPDVVGIMCPATIFKVIWNCLIFGIPHYRNMHVFVHGITLHVYYGITACWNILKCYGISACWEYT
jgi:hypothetical protein